MAIEVSHCGSGCSIGDVIAEFAVFWAALTIAGSAMAAEYVSDYALALIFGIMFQYFAIAPMRHLGLRDGLVQAGKADFISLTAFEVGLFSWMAIMAYILFPAPHPAYARVCFVLASNAGRHDDRFLYLLAGERMAGQTRDQGPNVSRSRWIGRRCSALEDSRFGSQENGPDEQRQVSRRLRTA